MSRPKRRRVLTAEAVLAATDPCGTRDDINAGKGIIYWSPDCGHREHDKTAPDPLKSLNHPDAIARVCRERGWEWLAYGKDTDGQLYGIAKAADGTETKRGAFDWEAFTDTIAREHASDLERAKRQRVTFAVT